MKSLQKKQKTSRKDAKAQRNRKEKIALRVLCVFATLRALLSFLV
jgi:hypothetical protein